MRCRIFCIRNGVANGSNIYNVVSDEYFKQRIKRYKPWMQPENWANQHLILWRNLFSMGLIPVCLRTLWEGYSQNRKYRILHLKLCRPIRTASHSLLLSSKKAGKLIQLADWRREVVEFTVLDAGKFDDPQQGSSINTDVMTDVSSPEAAVDVVDSHCKSDQSKYQILTLLIHNLNLVNI